MVKIFTIGHSTRSIKDFLEILQKYDIQLLVDLRSLPGSTYNPQFNDDQLAKSLASINVEYLHLSGLTGFRKSIKNSLNPGLRSKSFRAFADHMQTDEFKNDLKILIKLAKKKRIVIMCAEAVVWRCHRSLVGDALTARGVKVYDIYNINSVKLHKLPDWVKIVNKTVIYPEMTEKLK